MTQKNNSNDPIVIVAAKRTPVGNFNGYFKNTPTTELGTAAIKGALEAAHLKPEQIQEVYMGCVLPAGLGQAPARQAAIGAGIPSSVPATTVNKMCGSGMKATMLAFDSICGGHVDIVVAGGMENMTRAPYLIPKARFGYRLGHGEILDHMMLDGLEDAYDQGRPMGYFAEQCASKYQFSRQQQDEFASASLQRAKDAAENGHFAAEIVPMTITDRKQKIEILADEGPTTVKAEKIPQLPPAFVKEGTVTAANSSSISDGAAALILMKQSQAKKLGLKALAILINHYSFAQAPSWFTTAPIGAIRGLLKKINWSLDQVDLYEINEAFAVVTMVTMKELQLDYAKVNVHGGACVLGHPIGASGARILITLIHALHQRKLKRGIAALCIGGGEATAVAIEIVN